ncbi:uncharacterized protein N7500_006144 [Penicillium coprophilum]|uniref:uncharacterized protein n=1 Tax=Penicillium coprophilum TaxID=36646 RepID=UPI00239C1A93|nr:uncharacterized protein N7500_006144 [Penicillium coprophilum]KAJ5164314.1 hypothetical protein N7500_006144 [Penicillium coprophilum]
MTSVGEEPFKSIWRESTIKALVGENKTVYHIHPGALIQGKSALTARVTAPWKNAGKEELDWSDFDEETIDCVLMFCYAEHCRAPGQKSFPSTLRSCAGDALVLHAKVYSFALRYLVKDLQHYALGQMIDCFEPLLEEHDFSSEPASARLADTVRIIYGNTPSSNVRTDYARGALCSFIAHCQEKFSQHYIKFQEDTGEFMKDLAYSLSKILSLADPEKEFDLKEDLKRDLRWMMAVSNVEKDMRLDN